MADPLQRYEQELAELRVRRMEKERALDAQHAVARADADARHRAQADQWMAAWLQLLEVMAREEGDDFDGV